MATSSDILVSGLAGGGGIAELVEDTSPQLGGNLDLNGNVIIGLEIGTNVQAYDADTAKTDVVQAYTAQQNFSQATLTSSAASIAWDLNTAQTATHTATENTTLANPTNQVAGATYQFTWVQHASAAKTLAFGANYKFSGSSTVSATLSSVAIFTFTSDGTYMRGVMTQFTS